jgi:hypothetical protein
MRDTTKLHPKLQQIIPTLLNECKKQNIFIKIGECVRTVAEQDALYAKGRTAPGGIVTKAKGSTYSSMHQWGVAFDFYLDMDIDGDGSKSDDAFNDKLGTFKKVGKIGEAIGLEWGGDWDAIVDKPHFQLPDWGSTPAKLKQMYGTPNKFKASWKHMPTTTVSPASTKEDVMWAQSSLNQVLPDWFPKLKVDGDYGSNTRIAVLVYWNQLGWNKTMKDDGTRIGSSTRAALEAGRKE